MRRFSRVVFLFVPFPIIGLFLQCFFMAGCGMTGNAAGGTEVHMKNTMPNESIKKYPSDEVSEKISPQIRSVLATMSEKGITRETTKERGAPNFSSSSSVRVSEDGKIQTYIYLNDIDAEKVKILEAYEVVIEITNYNLGIVQAWVPFDKIYDIAQLIFVKRISTPDYAISR